jgi:hypothetical protein
MRSKALPAGTKLPGTDLDLAFVEEFITRFERLSPAKRKIARRRWNGWSRSRIDARNPLPPDPRSHPAMDAATASLNGPPYHPSGPFRAGAVSFSDPRGWARRKAAP